MKIILEPYYQKLMLKFVDNPTRYCKKKFKYDHSIEGLTVMDKGIIYMVLPKKPSMELISHEAFHAVHYCLAYKGVALDEHGEAYAYLLGKLIETIINKQNGIKQIL